MTSSASVDGLESFPVALTLNVPERKMPTLITALRDGLYLNRRLTEKVFIKVRRRGGDGKRAGLRRRSLKSM
jgi:hypothetical protein